jgi:hypothetical protein
MLTNDEIVAAWLNGTLEAEGDPEPGMDWGLSPEAKAAIDEIDDNIRRAAVAALDIVVD